MTINAGLLRQKFDAALTYEDYLETDPERATPWRELEQRCVLSADQQALLERFSRRMPVLCLSGIWCGDCAQQGPLLEIIARGSDCIDLRWLDRDEHLDLAEPLRLNAGLRVPMVIFMAEDFEPVSVAGDRTLSRYRSLAARKLGGACPLPGAAVAEDEVRATTQEWLDEFERVHLLLRLSGRLRQKHGD
ncbi:MAG: thiol reductase thioredoxin [Phycisphaerales bacterium]|nr:thioredoxin family protein [Phycisphaerae bacterium]NNF45031.1 thiol reductase thioredoxin [Phycisphaerales bacterium]NNM27630.1 thiol reductase thioredoxin [Phycisphaerales bacterium]